jgi:acyl carrier protein
VNIEEIVTDYITRELMAGKKAKIGPEDSLIGAGVIDSLTLLQLITFLEEKFGVTISDNEMARENIESIRAIANFIEKKTGAGAS